MNVTEYDSPVGKLWLSAEEGKITALSFEEIKGGNAACDPVLNEAVRQLSEYFAGTRKAFSLPLKLSGTEFQKKVWGELVKIPFGETRAYGDIAKAIGMPKASRAVGMGCNRNKIAIIIPCHRVIGKNGSLTGFASGVGIKARLLDHERKNSGI